MLITTDKSLWSTGLIKLGCGKFVQKTTTNWSVMLKWCWKSPIIVWFWIYFRFQYPAGRSLFSFSFHLSGLTYHSHNAYLFSKMLASYVVRTKHCLKPGQVECLFTCTLLAHHLKSDLNSLAMRASKTRTSFDLKAFKKESIAALQQKSTHFVSTLLKRSLLAAAFYSHSSIQLPNNFHSIKMTEGGKTVHIFD